MEPTSFCWEVGSALEWFTPEGELNTQEAALEKRDRWLPLLKGETWAKTVRMLKRPESLTFLDRIARQLEALPLEEQDRRDALRLEAIRRDADLIRGEDDRSRALRAWPVVASLRMARDESFQQAVERVRDLFRRCWRASRLVEGIHSVVRMQQARHRFLSQPLLDLKRLHWNGRPFREGRRRGQSPYQHLNLQLPTQNWWTLLNIDPQFLAEKLSSQ